MNYADIKKYDVANGPGVRVSIFVSGCTHKCPGCFNEEAWDFNYGKPFTDKTLDYIIDLLKFDHYVGITFLGGEPMELINQQGLLPLARKIKQTYPDKSIWCFSGYDFENDIIGRMYREWPETKELLSYIDVFVDGKFIEAKKDLSLVFRGSSNQRQIMVSESIKQGKIILWEKPEYVQPELFAKK